MEAGQRILVGEGYIFELESRGYLKAGGFVPVVVLEHPELVKTVHQEMVHAGSDVVATAVSYLRKQIRPFYFLSTLYTFALQNGGGR